jgi:hypothetical protein
MRALGATAEVAKDSYAEVVERETLEQSVAADQEVRYEQFVALAIGEHFLDPADTFAVDVDDAAAEEQLQLHLSVF